ncbi:hypothetical protein C1H76_7610 [Elsinoe australis]|uniref:Uncharacterized protein n=1 Tax=Elsinoe australis TaxID=40998 RepID=A0A4U7AUD7_9PEZI|nr:hypothetical protein C1H76_7610 [Elsinoe australis]
MELITTFFTIPPAANRTTSKGYPAGLGKKMRAQARDFSNSTTIVFTKTWKARHYARSFKIDIKSHYHAACHNVKAQAIRIHRRLYFHYFNVTEEWQFTTAPITHVSGSLYWKGWDKPSQGVGEFIDVVADEPKVQPGKLNMPRKRPHSWEVQPEKVSLSPGEIDDEDIPELDIGPPASSYSSSHYDEDDISELDIGPPLIGLVQADDEYFDAHNQQIDEMSMYSVMDDERVETSRHCDDNDLPATIASAKEKDDQDKALRRIDTQHSTYGTETGMAWWK